MTLSSGIRSIDFEGDARQLVEDAYTEANDFQYVINNQAKRDYLQYRAFVDMTNRDNTLPNIALPKIFSLVETKSPQDVKALLGVRPYIPIEAKRKEFQFIAEMQTELLDDYLDKANFFIKSTLLFKLKTLYGTAFQEILPVYEKIQEKAIIPNAFGVPELVVQDAMRLRFKIKTYAPWEVFIDPYATNLEDNDGCRFVVKFVLTSKRAIMKNYEIGGYPELDIEKFMDSGVGSDLKEQDKNFGQQILASFGLNIPVGDDDMGIIMRYESPDRYIDVWNGLDVLRDVDNPYIGTPEAPGHKGINLNRIVHIQDAHTQNQIWGIGEAKPNEVQATMLNDLWNAAFRREQLSGEPLIFFRENSVDIDSLIWTTGNRIPVTDTQGRPISDSIQVHAGQEMSKDQFSLISAVERNIDLTSQSFSPSRGEVAEGQQTATEILKISETGSERQELSIKIGEQMFLKGVARKALGHISQFGTIADFSEILGEERTALMISANPADLPGGYNFSFKGSNRVVNQLVKQRNLKELIPQLTTLFQSGQFQMARILLDTFEIPKIEVDAIIQEAQLIMQLQLGLTQQQATGGQPGGRFKENNEKQLAQENAQALRG